MNVLLIILCYSIACTSDKGEVAAGHRDGAARRSGSAKDVAARKSAVLSSSSAKEVTDYRSQGEGQRSSPAKAVAVYRRNWAGQKTQPAHLSSSTKKVGNYSRDGAAQRSRSAKDVAARKSAVLSSSSAKEVTDYRSQGEGQRSSPDKAVAVYRRNLAGQKTQSAHLSSSTKKVGNYSRDGAAQRSRSAKDVAARKSAMLSSSSAKEVADYRSQGEGQRSSPAKAVAVYRRNWAGQKTQSAHLSSSTKKVPLDSKQKRDYRAPVTNVSIKPSISLTTEKTQRRRFTRTLNPKATKKMLRRIIFTTTARDRPQRPGPEASKKPVRFKMPTRLGRFGHLEIVPPTIRMPPFDPSKPIGRRKKKPARVTPATSPPGWKPNSTQIGKMCLNIMTDIVYATQGNNMVKVETVAERYKHDTRYRMAFILLKLDLICTRMIRKQTFIEHKLVLNKYVDRYYWLQKTYPFRKVLSFYTDMLRQNIDVTYAIEYVFRLYREKALERQSAREMKKQRDQMKAAMAKQAG